MMADINTTNLNDLPSDPSVGGNVKMNVQDNSMNLNGGSIQNQMSLDQTTISQIVNGLQEASRTGATRLPSSHIPMTQTHITTDDSARPNYVPVMENNRYINDVENYNYNFPEKKSMLDTLYENFQYPLLLGILFFIFQMPSFKNFAFQNASFLFSTDGNYNFNGLTIMSVLFSLIYYVFTNYIFI